RRRGRRRPRVTLRIPSHSDRRGRKASPPSSTVSFSRFRQVILDADFHFLFPVESPHTQLHSARLLPVARPFSERVVEGTHHVIAEGTGLEPYSPCQGLVRGQGGLEDVHACVDLAVHAPFALQALEHLAHPISAPGATRWAGLGRPLRVDLDDRHALEGGLVLDLTVN